MELHKARTKPPSLPDEEEDEEDDEDVCRGIEKMQEEEEEEEEDDLPAAASASRSDSFKQPPHQTHTAKHPTDPATLLAMSLTPHNLLAASSPRAFSFHGTIGTIGTIGTRHNKKKNAPAATNAC